MTHRSLGGRLTRFLTLVTVTLLLACGGTIYLGVGQALSHLLDRTLESLAATEAASAFEEPDTPIHIHDSGKDDTSKVACITEPNGRVLAATANLKDGPGFARQARESAFAGESATGFATIVLDGQRWRCIAVPIDAPGGKHLMEYLAVPLQHLEETMQAVRAVVLAVVLAGALIAWLASNRLGRRLTDPLRELADAADRLRAGTRTDRLPSASNDVELRSLTDALNTMLDRLHAALRRERDLNEAQQRFVADAAHELRSPLTNLHCALEVTLRRPRDAEAYRAALQTAFEQVQRLTRLANDLLTLSRTDAGQLQLSLGPCDLADHAARSIAVVRPRFDEAGLALEMEGGETPVWADCDRLEQVVMNLLDNALRHAPRGTAVRVRAETSGESCQLRVVDQGPGVPVEERERIFERFHRLDKARARAAGGSGLGLAIARGIMVAHGGGVHVEESAGGGACFVCSLPRRRDDEEGDPEASDT